MTPVDPWRGHLACVVFAALLAPKARDLELWLRHAHKAVSGASALESSVYAQARLELLSDPPPWRLTERDRQHELVGSHLHEQRWSEGMRIDEMARMLDVIREDGKVLLQDSKGSLVVS